MTHRGRTVPAPMVRSAERLLAIFNEHTGSRLGARTQDGRASEALRQICGALLDRPGEGEDAWVQGVMSMIVDPPSWLDGQRFMVGHLFGPRAAEHTLARGRHDEGAVPRRNGRVDWGAVASRLEAEAV